MVVRNFRRARGWVPAKPGPDAVLGHGLVRLELRRPAVNVFRGGRGDHVDGLGIWPLALDDLVDLHDDVRHVGPFADPAEHARKRLHAGVRIEVGSDRRGVGVALEEELERDDRICILPA
jgi:hypothetical protein